MKAAAAAIERRFPGKEKSRREVTISTDLVYDVLRKHQSDHILLRAARADAATGQLDGYRYGIEFETLPPPASDFGPHGPLLSLNRRDPSVPNPEMMFMTPL